MANATEKESTTASGRQPPPNKAPGILFELSVENEAFLREQNAKTGVPMVRIVDELIEFRRRFKVWPPKLKRS